MSNNKKSLSMQAVNGMSWGLLGGVLGKLAGFIAQIYLGLVLSIEDFALFAVATSCASIFYCLVNGGTTKVLIQKGNEYDTYAYAIFLISLLFNFIVFILLAVLAIPLSLYYNSPLLKYMLLMIGVGIFLSSPGHVLHATLIRDLKFAVVQLLAICSHIVRYGTTILFAFLGFGPLSFVLPLIIIAVTDNLFAWLVVKKFPKRINLNSEIFKNVLKDSKWVMIGSFSGALIQNGDNLAISIFAEQKALGVYFFAFQLTFAFASLIGGTLQTIIMPILVSISSDDKRQWQGIVRAISLTTFVSCCLSAIVAIFLPFIIHNVWDGKWDEAILVSQILSFAMPALLMSWIGKAAVEARGRWFALMNLSVVEGIGTVIVAILGSIFGDLLLVASLVSFFKFISGVAHLLLASKIYSKSPLSLLQALFSSYLCVIVCLLLIYFYSDLFFVYNTMFLYAALTCFIFVLLFSFFSILLCRSGLNEFINLVKNFCCMQYYKFNNLK